MLQQLKYLYRGTSIGWPGSAAIQQLSLTCMSSDPLVATLFALECSRHASAVICMAEFARVNGILGPSNALGHMEAEITLAVSPSQFERNYVAKSIAVARAREILDQLGFKLPFAIGSYAHLHYLLKEALTLNNRLDPAQIREFDRLALA